MTKILLGDNSDEHEAALERAHEVIVTLRAAVQESADYFATLEAHPWLTIHETNLLATMRAALEKSEDFR